MQQLDPYLCLDCWTNTQELGSYKRKDPIETTAIKKNIYPNDINDIYITEEIQFINIAFLSNNK